MKPILFVVAIVSLFLPEGHSVSGFSSAVSLLTHHNKLHHQKTTSTSKNVPFSTTTTTTTRANSKNTQLQALPVPVSTATTAAISLLRGGGESILNLSREGYYLQTLATYGTVTALIMNAALRLYSSTKFPKRKDDDTNTVKYMNSLFTAVTSLCIISGAFTAVLFNILGIYSKSALGMVNEEGYLAFRAATHVYSRWGFRTFLATCMSFVGSFLLSLYARIKNENDTLGRAVLIGSMIITIVGAYHIRQVLGLATKFIYTPEFLGKLAN